MERFLTNNKVSIIFCNGTNDLEQEALCNIRIIPESLVNQSTNFLIEFRFNSKSDSTNDDSSNSSDSSNNSEDIDKDEISVRSLLYIFHHSTLLDSDEIHVFMSKPVYQEKKCLRPGYENKVNEIMERRANHAVNVQSLINSLEKLGVTIPKNDTVVKYPTDCIVPTDYYQIDRILVPQSTYVTVYSSFGSVLTSILIRLGFIPKSNYKSY